MTGGASGPAEDLARRLHDTARRSGPAPALAMLHRLAGRGAVVRGPGGHALVPTTVAHAAGGSRPSGPAFEVLRGLGVEVLRGAGDADEPPGAEQQEWSAALLWLRLGLSTRLLDAALDRIGAGISGGAPLTQQQLVKGELADLSIARAEIRALLTHGGPEALTEAALGLLHDRLTDADRRTLKLLGAWGFALDGPGADAYASELLADIYLGAAA